MNPMITDVSARSFHSTTTARQLSSSVESDGILSAVQRVVSVQDADMPLLDGGLDSLAAIELRNALQRVVGGGMNQLPSTIAFDFPTIRSLEEHLRVGRSFKELACLTPVQGNDVESDVMKGPLTVIQVPGLDASGENATSLT